MSNFKDYTLEKSLPSNLSKDVKVLNASKTLTTQNNKLFDFVDSISNIKGIAVNNNAIADYLLWELNMPFYQTLYAATTLEDKRNLINKAIYLHQIKGTPAAIEELIEILFGDGQVEEWFEYGGDPYHFRVRTSNPTVTTDRAQEFIQAVNYIKRGTTVLESVLLTQQETHNLYMGAFIHEGTIEKIRQVG